MFFFVYASDSHQWRPVRLYTLLFSLKETYYANVFLLLDHADHDVDHLLGLYFSKSPPLSPSLSPSISQIAPHLTHQNRSHSCR